MQQQQRKQQQKQKDTNAVLVPNGLCQRGARKPLHLSYDNNASAKRQLRELFPTTKGSGSRRGGGLSCRWEERGGIINSPSSDTALARAEVNPDEQKSGRTHEGGVVPTSADRRKVEVNPDSAEDRGCHLRLGDQPRQRRGSRAPPAA